MEMTRLGTDAEAIKELEKLQGSDAKRKKLQERDADKNSVEQQVRKYTKEPVTLWSDNCECKNKSQH
jgi:hypothetical protein